MKPYKMKHIPTGLYFQPHKFRGSHLSKSGKIYQSKTNGISSIISGRHESIRIACQKDSIIHKLTKDKLCWTQATYSRNQLICYTNINDWIKEEI